MISVEGGVWQTVVRGRRNTDSAEGVKKRRTHDSVDGIIKVIRVKRITVVFRKNLKKNLNASKPSEHH